MVWRPLARWVDQWARRLLSLVGPANDADQTFADKGASGLEEVLKRLLRGGSLA